MNLDSLFHPRTVALLGASRTPGKVGHQVLSNLVDGGFEGELVFVNPAADQLRDRPSYKDLRDYDGTVDLSVIVVPPSQVEDAVDASIEKGAQCIIVISAGFKEIGPEGSQLEERIAETCRKHQVRLLGPNSLGLINTQHRLNASFVREMPELGRISVVSQSGALCTAIVDWLIGCRIGLAKLVHLGNKAGVSECDLLLALSEDPDTRVIVVYVESIASGPEFLRAAETAASKTPVVIMKSAVTEGGRAAASLHTGSLSDVNLAYAAAFHQCGLVRADDFDSLLDYATALALQPLPAGDRVAIVTNGGGAGVMAADAVLQQGMSLAGLTNETNSALRKQRLDAPGVGNPVDLGGDAGPERYAAAIEALQEDATVDALIVILTPYATTNSEDVATAIVNSSHGVKPMVAVSMGGLALSRSRARLTAANVPDYTSPKRAVGALRAMCEYGAWRRMPDRVIVRSPVNRRRVQRIFSRYRRMGRTHVGEVDAKEILNAYAFTVPRGQFARSAEEALDAANRIGFPVALKLVSPDILHKSHVGGVKLDLTNLEAVRDAYDLMALRTNRLEPEAKVAGVYVEKMCPSGVEVIIGMLRDPKFGPMLMFGLGGIFVEILKDVSFHLVPISTDEAMEMLMKTRSYDRLKDSRGESRANIQEIARCLQRISQLAMDFPEIAELDINPLIVGTLDTEPLVADAAMTLMRDDDA